MRSTTNFRYLFIAFACICSYSFNVKDIAIDVTPKFVDKGRTIDSLKKIYNCENISYENWDNKNESDSCLTVCFINSTKVPSAADIDNTVSVLKGIASAIKKALVTPQVYRSYYIIFVKKQTTNGMEIKSHSAGMKITAAEL